MGRKGKAAPAGEKRVPPRKQEQPTATTRVSAAAPARRPARRCNDLTGKRWLQNSISVWSDIRKTTEETRLNHPALFPTALVERLIETFLPPLGETVLDPFAGCG